MYFFLLHSKNSKITSDSRNHILEKEFMFITRLKSGNFEIFQPDEFNPEVKSTLKIFQNVTRIVHEISNYRIKNHFCNFCLGKTVGGRLPEDCRIFSSDTLVNFEHLSYGFCFINPEFNIFLSSTVCDKIKFSKKQKL